MANEIPNSFEFFNDIGTPLDPLTEQRYNVTGLNPPFENEAAPPSQRLEISPFEQYLLDLQSIQEPVYYDSQYSEQQPVSEFSVPNVNRPIIPANFGPITQSGYTQPQVDPMSYYNSEEKIENTDYSYNPNAPTRWYETRGKDLDSTATEQIKQDLINNEINAFNLKQSTPVAEQLNAGLIISNPTTGLPVEVVPNPDFVEPRVVPNPPRGNLPEIPPGMLDPVMDYDQWKWVDRYILKPDKPAPPKEDENVKYLTPEEIEQTLGGQTPTPPVPPQEDVPLLAPGIPPTTGLPTIVKPRPVVSIPKPNLNLPEPPKYTDTVRNPGRIIPFKMPTEVPIPARRAAELLAPGYSQDINYDPDEILAAAMRVIRGRSAGRSLMD